MAATWVHRLAVSNTRGPEIHHGLKVDQDPKQSFLSVISAILSRKIVHADRLDCRAADGSFGSDGPAPFQWTVSKDPADCSSKSAFGSKADVRQAAHTPPSMMRTAALSLSLNIRRFPE
jgi:hypothetical protein